MKIIKILKVIIIIIIAIIGVQIFRYQTGYFPSQSLISKFESQVESKMTEYLTNNGYDEEEIQNIDAEKIPKARKQFDVVVTFENGNIKNYIVDDIGETNIKEK